MFIVIGIHDKIKIENNYSKSMRSEGTVPKKGFGDAWNKLEYGINKKQAQ
jgi:hypothetical protein